MSSQPFLILSLRRTGGTSLMGTLSRLSPHPAIPHEPFNRDRLFGATTKAFTQSGDEAALAEAIAADLARTPNIKHCVEVVPQALTRALITHCHAAGYRIFLLTRRDELSRQRSLLLAQSSGAWGPVQAAKLYPEIERGARKCRPVALKALPDRVRRDQAAIGTTLQILRNREIPFDWLVFEELYRGDIPLIDHLRRLAAEIGIEAAPEDPRFEHSQQRSPSSAGIEPFVPGFEAAMARLATLCIT